MTDMTPRDARMATVSCEDCGEPATRAWDEGYDFAFWTGQPRHTPVCAECWTVRDNREPREVTFDEALGFKCDEQVRMDAARRLK